MKARAALVCVLACLAAPAADAMTPEEAYAAIPHKRTTFDAAGSKLTPGQSASLSRIFAMTDQGVVLRVQGMLAHRQRDAQEVKRVVAGYDSLIAAMESEKVDAAVEPARELIARALRDQRRYLASRPAGLQFARGELTGAEGIGQSHRQLMDAYSVLTRAFPGEVPRNKTAFYDYLCALDFL